MHRLQARLGDPQEEWPVVHVAGTKGKGSTTVLLANILGAAGYKVAAYTRYTQFLPIQATRLLLSVA
jgi:folylpolyglutamate synthase/dihydropteroate synthase